MTTPHSRRGRRGNTLVEWTLSAALYSTFLFGIIELSWIANVRGALLNGAARAGHDGAAGRPLAAMRQDVRDGSLINIPDSYIVIEYNSATDGSGRWSDATDVTTVNGVALANAVPAGAPLRVRVIRWPHRL